MFLTLLSLDLPGGDKVDKVVQFLGKKYVKFWNFFKSSQIDLQDGGKPSTWIPPGRLVEQNFARNHFKSTPSHSKCILHLFLITFKHFKNFQNFIIFLTPDTSTYSPLFPLPTVHREANHHSRLIEHDKIKPENRYQKNWTYESYTKLRKTPNFLHIAAGDDEAPILLVPELL